jgi:CubicO group peptidase (beta-lactamase class C family)
MNRSLLAGLALVLAGCAAGPIPGQRADPAAAGTLGGENAARKAALLDSIVNAAVRAGAVPGAAIAFGSTERVVHTAAFGRLDRRDGFGAVSDSTIYDLASLTKVVATTTLAMMLTDDGVLDIDAPVERYLPEWRGEDRAGVTVRALLTHEAGLKPFDALHAELRGRAAYLERIVAIPLEHPPGSRTLYSDFGPILLGIIIERISGRPLDVLFAERVAGPLGLRETGFNPAGPPVLPPPGGRPAAGAAQVAPDPLGPAGQRLRLARIAPTEIDTVLRHAHVHGTVHDENGAALGGVAGHAGLFGSARDLGIFARLMLGRGTIDGRQLIRPETVARFTARQGAASSRAIGWDTAEGNSSAGSHASPAAFGHTGFTGTSIWIDPASDRFVVLLTNRVNPTRANTLHIPLRRAVADAVFER